MINTVNFINIALGIAAVDKVISYTHILDHFIYAVMIQCDKINIIEMVMNRFNWYQLDLLNNIHITAMIIHNLQRIKRSSTYTTNNR